MQDNVKEFIFDQLQKAYNKFLDNKIHQTALRLRRYRQNETKSIIENREIESIEEFNSKLWNIETKTLVNGEDIKIKEELYRGENEDISEKLKEAMDNGTIELNGNYIWGTATRKYAPRLKDEETVFSLIQDAFDILSSTQPPFEKYKELTELYGFGPSIASGFVLIMHPEEFMIYNQISKDAMRNLGFEYENIQSFYRFAQEIREKLGIKDFLELDLFLLKLTYGSFDREIIKFWWVNQGKTDPEEIDKGIIRTATINQSGRKIGPHLALKDAKEADIVFNYNSELIAISPVIKEPYTREQKGTGGQEFIVETEINYLSNPIDLKSIDEDLRKDSNPFDGNGIPKQGYFFQVNYRLVCYLIENFKEINQILSDQLKIMNISDDIPSEVVEYPSKYLKSLDSKQKEVNFDISDSFYNEIVQILNDKPQIILYGPPGTGKTYYCQEFAKRFTGFTTNWAIVQFHPSYSYEDFVEGISVTTKDNNIIYKPEAKIFREIAERAAAFPSEKFVLIIDEINRGNMANIFGELIYSLEYRKSEIHTLYMDEMLKLPDNLFILGTMNSIDHSVKLIDHAMRRRFNFYYVDPSVKILSNYLDRNQVDSRYKEKVIGLFKKINNLLNEHTNDKDYKVGHTYYFKTNIDELMISWEYSIKPQIEILINFDQAKMKEYDLIFERIINNG